LTQESPENISDVVSDFNTTKQQLKDLIIRISSQWFVLDIVGHQFTWFNRGKNSCFDFRVINNKLRNYWKETLNNSSSLQELWDISQPISISEIHSTIFSMKNNKPSGPDDTPIKSFWE